MNFFAMALANKKRYDSAALRGGEHSIFEKRSHQP
jgi:hypothetical protein